MSDQLVFRNVWISSGVLSLALFGDALLYVVLPLYADAFGISIAMVGFLLAVNRMSRIFFYGLIVQLSEKIGPKKLCVIAAITATISTACYGWFDGEVVLILSRVLWGLSYASLLIVTLTFASMNSEKTGIRIGISRSIEQIGPLFVMTVGAWLVSIVGPRDVFLYLAVGSSLSIFLSISLCSLSLPVRTGNISSRDQILPRPDIFDIFIFFVGIGIDGIFTVSISLMWAQYVSLETAILFGGGILAARRLSEMLIAPCAGIIADKLGARIPFLITIMLTIFGFSLIGLGLLLWGSVLIVFARGALGTFFPSVVSRVYPTDRIKALARNQTWRDVGAAVGPLASGVLLSKISPESLHLGLAIAFTFGLIPLYKSPSWRMLKKRVEL